jgi:putative ABC transport system permease protein
MSLTLALRELRNNPRFALLFVLNLAVGLFGFVSLDGFKRSFQEVLYERSKAMLTADLSVSARRPISEAERQTIRQSLDMEVEQQDAMTLYSMALNPANEQSELVELKAIEDNYPFYGAITLRERGTITGKDPKPLNDEPLVWLSPELLISLELKPGDTIKLGEIRFTVDDVIEDDTSMSWAGAAFAPRIYLSLNQLQKSGLVKPGSTIWRRIYFKTPTGVDPGELETRLFKELQSPAIRVRSHLTAGENNGRLLAYLTDYLGLVSLVAFFLSGLGAIYLFRGYLLQKHREIATLLSLGMTHVQAVLTYTWQILVLGAISALLSSLAGWGLLPLSADVIGQLTPISFVPVFSPETVVVALMMGALGTLLLCVPLLAYIKKVSPGALFQEVYEPHLDTTWRTYLLATPALLLFYGLSVWQANSWLVGSLFFALLMGASLVLAFFAWWGLKGLRRLQRLGLSSRLAVRYLHANRMHAIACFLALSLGTLLINLIPQVRQSLLSELERPTGTQLPSLFLFDIQDQQKEPLLDLLQQRDIDARNLSPMIRGRLKEVNGEPFSKGEQSEQFSREAERAQRMRNRGVNLSYRDSLSASEEIIAGRPFSGPYQWASDNPIEVSLEERYAERLELEIGDRLTFEVQGLPIEGKVISLRRIKWNSFQPNFFIQLQPGALDDAPKTFLGWIPPLSPEQKQALQSDIVSQFPNVSIIDVSRLVDKLTESIAQMSWILQLMAWISITAGMVVVFSIAIHQAQTRRWDINLMKILGASFHEIQATILKEFAILSLAAGLLGGILGVVVSFVMTQVLFDGIWRPDLVTPVVCLAIIMLACLLIALAATRKTLKLKPAWVVNAS